MTAPHIVDPAGLLAELELVPLCVCLCWRNRPDDELLPSPLGALRVFVSENFASGVDNRSNGVKTSYGDFPCLLYSRGQITELSDGR